MASVTDGSREELERAFADISAAGLSLAEKCAAYRDRQQQVSPRFAAVNEDFVLRLAAAQAANRAPRPGSRMPGFVLPDESGRVWTLERLLDRGALVVSFNRGHWCNFCRLELRALAALAPELEGAGAQVVSIVPLVQPFAQRLKQDNALPFPVLTDVDGAYALSLGLLVWVGEEVKTTFESMGIDLALFHGSGSWMLPVPATFVIGADGRVRDRFVDVDFRRRMSEEQIRTALRAPTLA